jgi:hypothetical protein
LSYAQAAAQIETILSAARREQLTGVALKMAAPKVDARLIEKSEKG